MPRSAASIRCRHRAGHLSIRGDLTVRYRDGRTTTVSELRAVTGGRPYWGVSHELLIADFYRTLPDPRPSVPARCGLCTDRARGRLAAPAAGLGPGKLRAGRRAAEHRRLAMLREHLEYVQIKDALLADGTVVPAGKGDGEVARTCRALRHDGFDGFFSREPHLAAGTATGGFSGPELLHTAWQAFTNLLRAEEVSYA